MTKKMITQEQLLESGFKKCEDGFYSILIGSNKRNDGIYLVAFNSIENNCLFLFLSDQETLRNGKYVDIWRTYDDIEELKKLCIYLGFGIPFKN